MQPVNSGVAHDRVRRRVYHSALVECMMTPGALALGMFVAVIAGVFYPGTLWLTFPVLLVWSPVMLLEEWHMPMRMPMTMDRLDPSTQRQVPQKLFGFLPITVLRTTMSEAAGIIYMGYLRLVDAGRELWLSMNDLTRHMIFIATTGGGKTESLLSFVAGQLLLGKGLIFSDGKAQNDVPVAVASLARRVGREDDVRHMNFITGGKSRADELLSEDKSRPQTNTINAFGMAQETYIINLMDSMLPPAGNDGGWQEKARAMMQALVFSGVYKCKREGTVLSQRTIQALLPLRAMAKLYIQSVEEQWHEEARLPIENYLSTLAGFDLAKVHTPAEWAPEAVNQHGYLIQQFTRMLALFNDTYGHVFARGAGDIDLRDVVHNDRILTVGIPALELSSSEAATLGRLYVSQVAMVLSQDLGAKIEGAAEDILVVRKNKDRFPFLWILDEVGAYYTEKIGEAATQVRSLGYWMLLAGQDIQRLKSAAGDKVWTLIANMGIRIFGKTLDPKDTLETLQLMAGTEQHAQVSSLVRNESLLGGDDWQESGRLDLRNEKRVSVEEAQALQEGEFIAIFNGNVVRGASMYIKDSDKIAKAPVRINRFIEVQPPTVEALLAKCPVSVQRSYPRPNRIQGILRHLEKDSDRVELENLVVIDPVLAGVSQLGLEWQHIWARRPSAAVRSTLLWMTVLGSMPKRPRAHLARSRTARALTVSRQRIDSYAQQHAGGAVQPRVANPRPYASAPSAQSRSDQLQRADWSAQVPQRPAAPPEVQFEFSIDELQPPTWE